MGIKRRSSSARRYTVVTIIVLGLFVLVCRWTREESKPNPYYANVDMSVDTSSYVKEFEHYAQLKAVVKPHLDESNSRFKRVSKGARHPGGLRKSHYRLLMFTTVFRSSRFCHNPPVLEQCPFKNCLYTCDRDQARNADLVMFHADDLIREETETKVYLKSFLARLASRRNQIWVLWNDEVSAEGDTSAGLMSSHYLFRELPKILISTEFLKLTDLPVFYCSL